MPGYRTWRGGVGLHLKPGRFDRFPVPGARVVVRRRPCLSRARGIPGLAAGAPDICTKQLALRPHCAQSGRGSQRNLAGRDTCRPVRRDGRAAGARIFGRLGRPAAIPRRSSLRTPRVDRPEDLGGPKVRRDPGISRTAPSRRTRSHAAGSVWERRQSRRRQRPGGPPQAG